MNSGVAMLLVVAAPSAAASQSDDDLSVRATDTSLRPMSLQLHNCYTGSRHGDDE
jgi:hypothetical protein